MRRIKFMISKALFITVGSLFWSVFTLQAKAATFYLELGGGVDSFTHERVFFPELAESTGLGYTFNGTIGAYLWGTPSANVQFGIKTLLYEAQNANQEINMIVPTPLLRLELWRVYFGIGATPFIWGRSSDTLGLEYFARHAGLAALGEAGLMWKILPDFSMNLEGSALFVKTDAGLSPRPLMALTLQLRFLFSIGDKMKSSSGQQFDGWRYPFGFGK